MLWYSKYEFPYQIKQKEMIDMMYTASTSMIDVISDLLDISSMQHGKLKTVFSTVNLRKLIEDVLVSMSMSRQVKNGY